MDFGAGVMSIKFSEILCGGAPGTIFTHKIEEQFYDIKVRSHLVNHACAMAHASV